MERIFSSVRRTAAALQSAAGGHSELGMAVYGAKCEGEGLRALGHHHIHGENGGSQGRGSEGSWTSTQASRNFRLRWESTGLL